MCFPSYRQQGLLIARGYPLVEMMYQVYSNAKDPLKGRQFADHVFQQGIRVLQHQRPISARNFRKPSAGAMASAYEGGDRIAASWVGDGTTAEGDFHHACNFASGLSRAGHSQHRQQSMGDIQFRRHRGRQRIHLRIARYRLRIARSARGWKRFFWPSRRRRNGPSDRARVQSGRDLDRALHLSRRRPFDERRSFKVPPVRRCQGMAAGRSHRAPQSASHRAWRMERGTAAGHACRSGGRSEALPTRSQRRPSARWVMASLPSAKTMFEDVFKEMPEHLRRQRQEMGV